MQKIGGAISVAIACGGTGGHLFPGIAIGEQLAKRGCSVKLLVSPKRIDTDAVREATGLEPIIIPAIALVPGQRIAFFKGFLNSFMECRRLFRKTRPDAVLGMGGFTSAPPILAGKWMRTCVLLHESNTIPGRANRWVARFVNRAFVGFPDAVNRLPARRVSMFGTPVRARFHAQDRASLCTSLGLNPERPVLLVMGGSQGAGGINDLMLEAVPRLVERLPELQFFHLTGPQDLPKVRSLYASRNVRALVYPFFGKMEEALAVATLAVTRAGASTLAELAATRVPPILIPYPAAADDHQLHNAKAFTKTGAALLVEQKDATGESLARMILDLLSSAERRETMSAALGKLHRPKSGEEIADAILAEIANAWGVPLADNLETSPPEETPASPPPK